VSWPARSSTGRHRARLAVGSVAPLVVGRLDRRNHPSGEVIEHGHGQVPEHGGMLPQVVEAPDHRSVLRGGRHPDTLRIRPYREGGLISASRPGGRPASPTGRTRASYPWLTALLDHARVPEEALGGGRGGDRPAGRVLAGEPAAA